MRNILTVLVLLALSNFCFSDLSSPFNFTSSVKCKDPNGNDKDKDKLKINFEITSLYKDFENISVVPETTNGIISYNGNGERTVDLKKEIPFQDQFKVIPSDDGYFFVTLNFIKNDTIIFMERWYFNSIGDGVVQISQDEYFNYLEQKKNQMIYNDAYQRAVQWVYEKYSEGFTNNDLFILEDEDGSPEYIRMTCQENTIILHNHICPGTIGIKDALSSLGIKVMPAPIPIPGPCFVTWRNKDYTISGNLKYWDPVHKENVPIKNLLNDYDFYIETMVEINCPNAGITIRYVMNPVQIDQSGNFSVVIKAYTTLSNPNPVTKFRLIPKRSGWVNYPNEACQSLNLANFDVTPMDPGVVSNQISTYRWSYEILFSIMYNITKDYILYWQTMIVDGRSLNKPPLSSYEDYKAADGYAYSGNFRTVYCDGGKSAIVYAGNVASAWYPLAGIIFHEMAHQWHNSIYYAKNNSNLWQPDANHQDHYPCIEYSDYEDNEKLIFTEGFADWASTYMARPKYIDDLLWFVSCTMGECYDNCENSYKGAPPARTEAHVMSFLWDIFDPVELTDCKESDQLKNGACVDGIEKNESDLSSENSTFGNILEIGFSWQKVGFMGLWDNLYGDPFLHWIAYVNHLE